MSKHYSQRTLVPHSYQYLAAEKKELFTQTSDVPLKFGTLWPGNLILTWAVTVVLRQCFSSLSAQADYRGA